MSDEPQTKKTKMTNATTSLDQLKALTTIVADTGDFEGECVAAVSQHGEFVL